MTYRELQQWLKARRNLASLTKDMSNRVFVPLNADYASLLAEYNRIRSHTTHQLKSN